MALNPWPREVEATRVKLEAALRAVNPALADATLNALFDWLLVEQDPADLAAMARKKDGWFAHAAQAVLLTLPPYVLAVTVDVEPVDATPMAEA